MVTGSTHGISLVNLGLGNPQVDQSYLYNPQVDQSYLYPYLSKPIPVLKGLGFDGYG